MALQNSQAYSKDSICFDYPNNKSRFSFPYNIYHEIYGYILNNIVLNSNIFVSCDMFDEDEEGNPSIEFYIKYNQKLTYKQRKEYTYDVLERLYEFCISSGFKKYFYNISIFLIEQ